MSKELSIKLAFDKSNSSVNISHYFAMYLWLGWPAFYVYGPIICYICYFYFKLKILVTIVIVTVVTSGLYPVTRSIQPLWGYATGVWIMKKAAEYFQLQVYFEDKNAIDSKPGHIFVLEPHDVLPVSIFAFSDCLGIFPKQKMLGCLTGACFYVPMMKHFYTWSNAISVEKYHIEKALDLGKSPTVCPGGVAEVGFIKRGVNDCTLYLKSRKGLVKLALRYGRSLVPAFTFGQRKTFDFLIPPNTKFFRRLGKALGFLPIIIFGASGIPFGIAKSTPVQVVIGKPIEVPKILSPTDEDIDKYHVSLSSL